MPEIPHHRRIFSCVLILCIAISFFTGWVAIETRGYALEQARHLTDTLAEALDHHATRSLESASFALALVASRLDQDGAPPADPRPIHKFLRDIADAAPQIRNVVVFDADGLAKYDSASFPARTLSVADLAAFRVHKASPGSGVMVTSPSDAPGGWNAGISQRLNKPDGSFDGIVSASLDLAYFRRVYESLRPGEHGAIGLYTQDGELIVREPDVEGDSAKEAPYQSLLRSLSGDVPRGFFEAASPGDEAPRITSYRRIDSLPLIVTVSTTRDEALRLWRNDLLQIGVAGLVLLAIIVSLGFIILRESQHRTAAEIATKDALRTLERQHEILQMILRTFPDGVQLIDNDEKLVGFNSKLFEILDVDAEAILTAPDPEKALQKVCRDRGYFDTDLETLASRRDALDLRRRLPTGRWIECRGTPVDDQGYLAVFRDVTTEVEREAELRDANDRLERQAAQLVAATKKIDRMRLTAEEAFDEADRANRAKSTFLANMSHELRTPLNAINGFSEVIANLHFGEHAIAKYREYAADIHQSGQHLLGLINSVLDLAKIEAGRMELHEHVVDLDHCLRSAIKMVEQAAIDKRLTLRLHIGNEPFQIFADEQKLVQSFLNILSNAVKFTPPDGELFVELRHERDEIAVLFRDSGVGMSASDLDRIFTPFSRVESAMTRSVQGTGLGMSLTKNLVELHGGRIEIQSRVNDGTTVKILLPASRLARMPLRTAV